MNKTKEQYKKIEHTPEYLAVEIDGAISEQDVS